MKWLTVGLGFLILFFSSLANLSAQQKSEPIKAVQSWQGKVAQSALQSRAPRLDFVSDRETWSYIWRSWNADDPVPQVDFATKLVLMAVMSGPNRVEIRALRTESGDVRFVPAGTMAAGPGFGYRFTVINREGVQSVNGIPVSQIGFVNVRLLGKLTSMPDGTWSVKVADASWPLNFNRRPWLLEEATEMNGEAVYLAGAFFQSNQPATGNPLQLAVDVLKRTEQ